VDLEKNTQNQMDLQNYLQDLLTIDCNLQTKLQQLCLSQTRNNLEQKATEIKIYLKEYKQKLSEIKDFCNILKNNDNDSTKKEVFIKEFQIQNDHLVKIETNFRNVYLNQKKKVDNLERDSLLDDSMTDAANTSPTKSNQMRHRNTNKDDLIKQSSGITENLSELNRIIKSSLSQSKATLNTLEVSSKTLKSTHDEFNAMSTTIYDGKRLLTKYDQREFTNKLLFVFSLCLFFSVVFYIIWKRLF
jgi:hypothetical protein